MGQALRKPINQRVAIGRALLSQLRVLLMDEPLATAESLHQA